MFYKSLLLLVFTCGVYVEAQGNCDVTDPAFVDDWNRGEFYINIPDTKTDYNQPIQGANIQSVTLNHKYIDANVANNVLTFSAKPDFENFIENENSLQMKEQNIIFDCDNGQVTKLFTLKVTQTKVFPPKFKEKDYKFDLAMPITPNTIIDSTAMIVTDLNIDEKLTFAFNGVDAECTKFGFQTTVNNKEFTTKLKALDHVDLDKSINCNVVVTDKTGEKDEANIEIKVDIKNSKVPNPIFTEPLTIVNYAENVKTQLNLLSTTYEPKPIIVPDGKFAQYFNLNIVANNIIEIALNGEIPEDELENENYFVLLVEVEYDKADNKGKTAVLVDLNRKTATTTTSTTPTTTPTTTTVTSTTPCDCSTITPDPEPCSTIATTSESDTSSCPTCPDCTTTSDPGNISTCPTSPTTCPTSPTTCPECPDTTTSPGAGTTCPTTCPECPTTCPECPQTTLPGESTTCPTTCPDCPDTTTTSGEGTTCPECPITCPTSPETTLPGESTTCPACPDTTTTSGEGTSSTCPDCPITCPTSPETTTCPECPKTTLPGDSTTCPTTCPECPDTTTTSGEGTSSTCPDCPTTCPSSPDPTLPGGSTTCPECPTTCPTLPGESTTCPSNPECPSTSSDSSTSSLGPTTPSSSSSTTCGSVEPAPEVHFERKSSLSLRDKGTTGLVETFKAVSDIPGEGITYAIKTVKPTGAKDMFEITQNGEVNIIEELDEGSYDVVLTATGKQSKSQDEAMLFLIIKQTIITCPDKSVQVERLVNTKVKEGEAKKIIDANGHRLEFTTDNDDILDWFKFNENDGNLEVLKIDREDERIKSLLAPQIQIKIRAVPKNTPPQLRYNFTSISQYSALTKSSDEYSCLDIKNIDTKPDTMLVLVNVEDINDNSPIFVETSPLIIGYPEPKLIELIAPPYLVKVSATDEDFGDNARIAYTTDNNNFIADSESGIIFLANEINDNTEFKIIAEDNNGNNGNKAELDVKVKLLKEEHISVITIENIAYSEIEDKVKEISASTKQTVKYLTSTALPKVTKEDKKLWKVYADDEKLPAVRIILYALDSKNEIVSAKDFKEIADDLGIEIKVEEYIAALPNSNGQDETGWIAAVSTLSVLLALVIIGGLLGYIFYLRPRMMESPSDGYKKHIDGDSIQSSNIETKIEAANTVTGRRATGFPVGFNPNDFDDDDEDDDNTGYVNIQEENEDDISTKMEEIEEDKKSIKSSKFDEDKPKTKSSGVKFDTNVTEIEIEISEF